VTHRQSFIALLLAAALAGCATADRPAEAQLASATIQPSLSQLGLTDATPRKDVEASVTPPQGWIAQPLKRSSNHTHQIWLSPSSKTAYGVIRFTMPFPLGVETALWGFLREMRRTEGGARLISKQRDADIKGLRFVAEGGQHTVRANILTRGTRGWAIYAGTLTDEEPVPAELELAERAREHTDPGISR
jgi:hypothetical protein